MRGTRFADAGAGDGRRLALPVAGATLAALAALACELPPGIDTVDPGEGEPVPAGTAEVNTPPTDEPWATDHVAWQPGGEMACPPGPPPIGAPAPAEPSPFVVELWDGLLDPCADSPAPGNRSIRISFSNRQPGTFTVAPTCTGALSAGALTQRFLGPQEERRIALEGTVTITGISSDDVVDGVFSVRFEGDTAFTSGGFRAAPGCVSAGG